MFIHIPPRSTAAITAHWPTVASRNTTSRPRCAIRSADRVMARCSLMVIASLMALCFLGLADAQRCVEKLSACSCRLDNGATLDLNPLSTGNTPAFDAKDGSGTSIYYYQWDPCRTFVCQPSGGAPVAVCQTDKSIYSFDVGDQASAKFEYDTSRMMNYIQYTTPTTNGRSTKVFLKCDRSAKTPQYTVTGEVPIYSSKYEIVITSEHACGAAGSGEDGWSVGDVLILTVFLMALVYLAVGIAVNIFVRHQSGTAVIPQRDFWFSLPGLVKEGVVFSANKARGRTKADASYDEV